MSLLETRNKEALYASLDPFQTVSRTSLCKVGCVVSIFQRHLYIWVSCWYTWDAGQSSEAEEPPERSEGEDAPKHPYRRGRVGTP